MSFYYHAIIIIINIIFTYVSFFCIQFYMIFENDILLVKVATERDHTFKLVQFGDSLIKAMSTRFGL